MDSIVVYAAQNSNRLVFILDWLVREQLQLEYRIVSDPADIPASGFFISYGKHFLNALSIPDAGLLWQDDIMEHPVPSGNWYGLPTLYSLNDASFTLPFDLLSALFFLLSRYEEYYPFPPDRHGRYPATQSILYRNGWLQRPIADEWVQELRVFMTKQYDCAVPQATFTFQPSYDIDIAYSYNCKGWQRNTGGYVKDALTWNIPGMLERTEVLFQNKKDPYDSFDRLQELHKNRTPKPVFFILATFSPTDFDKNIPPYHPEMKKLIRQLATYGIVGVHPSYYSTTHEVLVKEKRMLEKIIKNDIHFSRQHYIKFTIPHTYHYLMNIGIKDECSMGYATHLGFRAGTGKSFLFYDLKIDTTTSLRIHPFCFMDTTAHFDERLRVGEAFASLAKMTTLLKKTNSRLVTIFHNFSLGNDHRWKGWAEAYKEFVTSV